jgi:UDP-N-acetylmuramyl pentapeptide phosphotransferase/UDP-N-acetylglucosamine-1-phosphate transferase
MDCMDGFAGGMTVIGGLCFAFLGWATDHRVMLIMSALLAGSSAGFLVHNFPPARIFMGDVGSVPIGFVFGALILWASHDGVFDLWVPLMIFSPFLVDATVTLSRRIVRGERIWEAHRSHYYQRLVLAGWSHRKTVLFEYGLMVVCGILAMSYHFGSDRQRAGALISVTMVYLALFVLVQSVERRAVS